MLNSTNSKVRSSGGAMTCWGVFSFATSLDLSRVIQWETSDEQMFWIRLHSLDTTKCYVPSFREIKKSILLKKKMNKRKNKKASHTKPERELYSQPQCRAQLRKKTRVFFLLKFLFSTVFFFFFSFTEVKLCVFSHICSTENDHVERKSVKEWRWKQL